MTTVVDFASFTDLSFSLQLTTGPNAHGEKTIEHYISAANPLATGEGALLSWNVRCDGSVTYEVTVNNVVTTEYIVTSKDWSAVQEFIGTGNIHTGKNTVNFRIKSGTGKLGIGDVVIWFRKNI